MLRWVLVADLRTALSLAVALGLGCFWYGCGQGGSSTTQPVVEPVDADRAKSEVQDTGGGPDKAVARLRKVRGDVRWQSSSAASWSRADEAQELRPADAVQTMLNGSTELVFILTGSFARLGPNTTLRVPQQPPRITRFKHLKGRLVARLASGDASRMEVQLPPGTLVLDRREGIPDSNMDNAPEAHVEIADRTTAVTMIHGEGTLERAKRAPVKITEQHFVEVDEGGEVVAEGVNPQAVELGSPEEGATITTRGRVHFNWIPIKGVDAYVVDVTKSTGESTKQRVEAPAKQTAFDLEAGDYQWTVLAESSGRVGVVGEKLSLTVVVDQSPPRLKLASPPIGATVKGSMVRVSGGTEPGATVEVNGQEVTVGTDGRFSKNLALRKGISNIVVRAVDDLGNARATSRTVVRE